MLPQLPRRVGIVPSGQIMNTPWAANKAWCGVRPPGLAQKFDVQLPAGGS